ncbi:MAG TPA: acetolactate synthase large subunit, partial [Idiomarina sp.]|nr:acetolactate synthase large subunit [Idiomarina sp.]
RTDTSNRFQLHGVDQLELAKPLTKAAYRVGHQNEVVETIYHAYQKAISGKPGPVLVEIPVNLQLFTDRVPKPIPYADFLEQQPVLANDDLPELVSKAAKLLREAKHPAMFIGWGARHAKKQLI